MLRYDWPGNVRELKNAVERAMILEDADHLNPECLPFAVAQQQSAYTAFETSSRSISGNGAGTQLPNGRSLPKLEIPQGGTSLEEVERALVEMAMSQANGNQTHAARLLDISRDALRYKLKKFGLIHVEEDEPTANAS
jgi:DNA-binding NtrC family response regulator